MAGQTAKIRATFEAQLGSAPKGEAKGYWMRTYHNVGGKI